MNDHLRNLRNAALFAAAELECSMPEIAIGGQGAFARKFADENSDIDLILCAPRSVGLFSPKTKWDDAHRWSVNILLYPPEQPVKQWSDKKRYVYGYETEIIRDRSNMLATLQEQSRLTEKEIEDRIVFLLVKLSHRGATYNGMSGQEWKGLFLGDRMEVWTKRGDIYSQHARINQIIDLLVKLYITMDGFPIPSQKWRYNIVQKGKRMNLNTWGKFMEATRILSYEAGDVERRGSLVIEILNEAIEILESEHKIGGNIGYKYKCGICPPDDGMEFIVEERLST